jgi:hypothetical protein
MFLLPKQPADRRETPGKRPMTTGVHGLHFEKHCPVVSHNEKIRYEIHMRIVQIYFVCSLFHNTYFSCSHIAHFNYFRFNLNVEFFSFIKLFI